MEYNAIIELTGSSDMLEEIADYFTDYHASVSYRGGDKLQMIITVNAGSLFEAISTVTALCEAGKWEVTELHVLSTAEFDKRAFGAIPPLLSVSEYADKHGVSTQAVREPLVRGTLEDVRVGSAWVIHVSA